jgi:hypothetical protein
MLVSRAGARTIAAGERARRPRVHRASAAVALALSALLAALVAGCGGGSGDSPPGIPEEPPPLATPAPGESPGRPPDPPGPSPDPPVIEPGPVAMRRLTEAQYRATIADLLGEDIVVAGRFEPDNRTAGLLAVGSSFVSVTPAGVEQYDAIARSVAAQALDPAHRGALVPCDAGASATDDACAEQFLRTVGRRLLRRPLSDEDVRPWLRVAREAASDLGDFHAGLEVALATILLSPEFLFRIEMAEPDPDDGGDRRLTSLSMASRLSYFLWNTAPDEELLGAAERGELVDDAALADQVDRLLDSPRLEASVRELFADLYGLDAIEQGLVRKDPTLFPAFSQAMIQDAREQTLRVVVEHLLTEDGDYRELFTTRRSFMTRTLGLVYRVPVRTPTGWEPFEFPADSRRAGLLTHASLLSLYAHPGRSSPTLRGKFIREVLLCQDVPPPPGNIDFSMFADDAAQNRSTARGRLEAHVANPACAGCHRLMDPLGLGLENMDGIGIERETENGQQIDPSGDLDGEPYDDVAGLGAALSRHPRLVPCLVESLFKYATGREPVAGERPLLDYLGERFAASGHRLRDLLRLIATSDAFRTTSGPREAATEGP